MKANLFLDINPYGVIIMTNGVSTFVQFLGDSMDAISLDLEEMVELREQDPDQYLAEISASARAVHTKLGPDKTKKYLLGLSELAVSLVTNYELDSEPIELDDRFKAVLPRLTLRFSKSFSPSEMENFSVETDPHLDLVSAVGTASTYANSPLAFLNQMGAAVRKDESLLGYMTTDVASDYFLLPVFIDEVLSRVEDVDGLEKAMAFFKEQSQNVGQDVAANLVSGECFEDI